MKDSKKDPKGCKFPQECPINFHNNYFPPFLVTTSILSTNMDIKKKLTCVFSCP
jgi:hypothetical protein